MILKFHISTAPLMWLPPRSTSIRSCSTRTSPCSAISRKRASPKGTFPSWKPQAVSVAALGYALPADSDIIATPDPQSRFFEDISEQRFIVTQDLLRNRKQQKLLWLLPITQIRELVSKVFAKVRSRKDNDKIAFN
ncbi:hypothetical protein BDV96DRAFT_603854 [Lophiotrema nucula]|uniref:Uncharacterized protein n=1 Tax=Lophiotrema nucula TaxID=690887 RepID=A0A6A5YW58_9PLEO|nr:hypothetical protein BDV96DRAFT_603854 [Lophiotrema nucula]